MSSFWGNAFINFGSWSISVWRNNKIFFIGTWQWIEYGSIISLQNPNNNSQLAIKRIQSVQNYKPHLTKLWTAKNIYLKKIILNFIRLSYVSLYICLVPHCVMLNTSYISLSVRTMAASFVGYLWKVNHKKSKM